MTTPPRGRHRAPEPPPQGSAAFGVWIAFLVLAIIGGLITAAVGNSNGWGVVIVAVVVLVLSASIAHTSNRAPTGRAKQELRYAGRTAERATIWWATFRVLNGIFRR